MSTSESQDVSSTPVRLEKQNTYVFTISFCIIFLPFAMSFGLSFLFNDVTMFGCIIWLMFFASAIELARNTAHTDISVVNGTLIVDSTLLGIRDVVRYPPGSISRVVSYAALGPRGSGGNYFALFRANFPNKLILASYPLHYESKGMLQMGSFTEPAQAKLLRERLCAGLKIPDEGFLGNVGHSLDGTA
ncbi:MAG: hypothetical protein QM776_07505 [Rhodocyclaceae bacterium]